MDHQGEKLYVSTLSEAGKKKAHDELNEHNDKDTVIAVDSLRQWINEQDWIKSPTNFSFLLRFLRVRKFSELGARETIEHYWANRTLHPEWCSHVDPADKDIQAMIRTGFFLCPPGKYDKQGRRVIFARLSNIDFHKLHDPEYVNLMDKTTILLLDWLATDENVQVYGLCAMKDFTGFNLEHMTAWKPDNSKKMMKFVQHSIPMRMKAGMMYNEPHFYDMIFSVLAPFYRQKIRDRIHLYGNSLVKIYEELGQEIFPREYLPDDYDGLCAGTEAEIAEQMIEDLMRPEFRDYMKDISSGKYSVDLEKRKHEHIPTESFRKLNVDL